VEGCQTPPAPHLPRSRHPQPSTSLQQTTHGCHVITVMTAAQMPVEHRDTTASMFKLQPVAVHSMASANVQSTIGCSLYQCYLLKTRYPGSSVAEHPELRCIPTLNTTVCDFCSSPMSHSVPTASTAATNFLSLPRLFTFTCRSSMGGRGSSSISGARWQQQQGQQQQPGEEQ